MRVRRRVAREARAVARIEDVDLVDLHVAEVRHHGGDDVLDVLDHVELLRRGAHRLPGVAHQAEHLDGGGAVLGGGSGLADGEDRLGGALRVGGDDDVGLEAALLERGTHGLELALGGGACRLRGGLGLALDGLRVALELGLHAPELVALREQHLLGFGLRELRRLSGGGLGAGDLLGGLVLGVLGVAEDGRDLRATERVEVAGRVGDVLDLQRVELEAELREVVVGRLDQLLGEEEAILVHLLGRQGRDDLADGALEGLLGDRLDLADVAAEEALDRVADHDGIRVDLHVRDRVDVQRDVAVRVRVLDDDVDRHEPHVHAVDALEDRDAERAVALLDHAVAERRAVRGRVLPTREDEGLVRARDEDEGLHDRGHHEEEDRDQDRTQDHEEDDSPAPRVDRARIHRDVTRFHGFPFSRRGAPRRLMRATPGAP